MVFCGSCRSCLLGHTNQCLDKRADMGFSHDAGYGPFELVHESNFFAVPECVSAADVSLLLDVMSTSSHGLNRIQRIRDDVESLYVGGAGPIGLVILAIAKLRYGADFPVHISDLSSWRLEFAERLGGIPIDVGNAQAIAAITSSDAAIDSTGKLDLLLAHRDHLAQIASHLVPVADIAEGFALFMAGETVKVIVTQERAA